MLNREAFQVSQITASLKNCGLCLQPMGCTFQCSMISEVPMHANGQFVTPSMHVIVMLAFGSQESPALLPTSLLFRFCRGERVGTAGGGYQDF